MSTTRLSLFLISVATSVLLFEANSIAAVVLWDEVVSGFTSLSTNNTNPTNFNTLALGTSRVSGSVDNSAGNVDVFRFKIAPGMRLDSILLVSYAQGDSLAFIAMDSGPSFPFNRQQLGSKNPFPDESLFIGGTTFGPGNNAIGADLLSANFIGGRFIGQQPTPEQTTPLTYDSLPSGEYTVYVQQQGSFTQYTLDLGVINSVPEPSSALLIAALGLIVSRSRNRCVCRRHIAAIQHA